MSDKISSRNEIETRLSRASVGRFSLYLRHLEHLLSQGATRVSSSQLGNALGVTDAQIRKDLAAIGSLGQPGIGYATEDLILAIRPVLGVERIWRSVLVGIGNLGRALMGYRGFAQRGFQIVALFDSDPSKVGTSVNEQQVHAVCEIPEVVKRTRAELGLIAVPSESAQTVCDLLVEAGIRGLLNFAPTMLRVPSEISLQTVDLTVQLEQLAFLVQDTR